MVQRVGHAQGTMCRRLYNQCSGTKTMVKRDVLNCCLILYVEMAHNYGFSSRSNKSRGKDRNTPFQPNTSTSILQTLFGVFKVRFYNLLDICITYRMYTNFLRYCYRTKPLFSVSVKISIIQVA